VNEFRELGSICEIVTKGTTPTTLGFHFADSGIPFLRAENIVDGEVFIGNGTRHIDAHTHGQLRRSWIQENDVLLTIAGTIGRAAFVRSGLPVMNCNQAVAVIRPGPDIFPPYLAGWLNSLGAQRQIRFAQVTATISNLSLGQIKALTIPLPPLKEQKRIATMLNKADAIRRKRQEGLGLADEFLRALFIDFFGDPAANPKKWPVLPLEDVTEKITDGEHLTPKRSPAGFKLLSARNIQDGIIDTALQAVDYISADELQRIRRRCDPSPEDVLISCSGTVGRVAIVETDEPFAMVRSVSMIRPDRGRIDSVYLVQCLRTRAMRNLMLRKANASSQANLFLNQIAGLEVPIPPIDLQTRFRQIASSARVLWRKHSHLYEQCLHMQRALTTLAFNG
jgi:type I restriction enzyme, S subunit